MEQAMIEAHKTGRILASQNASRRLLMAAAGRLTTQEGDAMIAGYYQELNRRMEKDRVALRRKFDQYD